MNNSQIPFEVKSLEKDGVFSGYASVFGVLDNHQDVMVKGAFTETLKNKKDIKLLWQHQTDKPIGVFTIIREDVHGLYVEGKLLLEVQQAKEAYELMKNGAVRGMSIGYSVKDASYDDENIRYLTNVELFEISLVTFPANEHAEIIAVKDSGNASEYKCLKKAIERAMSVIRVQ
ncbi:HK97 family phage prohead protease [Rickettsiales bacterium]|nr:HK97 family phage prohead protease [Rickettsiales bacterium]